MKKSYLGFLILFFLWAGKVQAQEITNAFDDLSRQGTVNESDSEMRKVASGVLLEKLIQENPASNYFCFTEDRMHDIRLTNAIPIRWIERAPDTRTMFNGTCLPGEFYTWQIGIYAPYTALDDIKLQFSDMINEQGQKIKASSMRCFNLSGVDTKGNSFTKRIDIAQGSVQPLWVGIDVPREYSGLFKGKVTVKGSKMLPTDLQVTLNVQGMPIADHGDSEGWRKTRLRWLDSSIGNAQTPTIPYIPIEVNKQTISYLGGQVELSSTGFPKRITTNYDQNNQLNASVCNEILTQEMTFIIETNSGVEKLKASKLKIRATSATNVEWEAIQQNANFQVTCKGHFEFDGSSEFQVEVKSKKDISVKDIRLEIPYTAYASKYWMGLGNKGGLRADRSIDWKWDVANKHQDKLWLGNVNAGMNIKFKDENYIRPLVNIYYKLGQLREPTSWGNKGNGGIRLAKETTSVCAYSGNRLMQKGEVLRYDFNTLITPVKPLNLSRHAQDRFYHSNSDISASYIPAAKKNGATMINIHHKKDIYPFINYPYYDGSVADLKRFIEKSHAEDIKVRLYYTTRELTVKIPELWALRSLGDEVIHDGPGKDTRTLIHRNGPNEWLNKNLTDHFIPAWYNAFREGKYKGDMDISVITTPDSRWNNYYLAGLDWMVRSIGLDGVYIDDSALDSKTLQRARRILDADGQSRLIDIHSWNHMNQWAGYANSLGIYLDLLPYVDRTWIGEGFNEQNTLDFWLVEMSGIPFGLMSETLEARNLFKGMIFGMLPRLPWSGNPVHLWKLWDSFGMKDAQMYGYWNESAPIQTCNENIPATVYINGDKALVAIANWTDFPQKGKLQINESILGFTPSKVSLPQIDKMQWDSSFNWKTSFEVMGRSGLIILLEK